MKRARSGSCGRTGRRRFRPFPSMAAGLSLLLGESESNSLCRTPCLPLQSMRSPCRRAWQAPGAKCFEVRRLRRGRFRLPSQPMLGPCHARYVRPLRAGPLGCAAPLGEQRAVCQRAWVRTVDRSSTSPAEAAGPPRLRRRAADFHRGPLSSFLPSGRWSARGGAVAQCRSQGPQAPCNSSTSRCAAARQPAPMTKGGLTPT